MRSCGGGISAHSFFRSKQLQVKTAKTILHHSSGEHGSANSLSPLVTIKRMCTPVGREVTQVASNSKERSEEQAVGFQENVLRRNRAQEIGIRSQRSMGSLASEMLSGFFALPSDSNWTQIVAVSCETKTLHTKCVSSKHPPKHADPKMALQAHLHSKACHMCPYEW